MSEQRDMDKQFQQIQALLIQESESRFAMIRQSRDYPEDWPEIAPDNIVLSKLGFSNEELKQLEDELDESDQKIVQHFLEHVRPKLAKGPDTPNDSLRKYLELNIPASGEMQTAKSCNCTIVTDDSELIKDREGTIHNPWLDPANAVFQDMLVRYGGTGGWGCRRRDEHRGSFDCHWVYPFTTDDDRGRRYHRFYGGVEFRGFFSCIAHDRFGICRSARVHASLILRVFQFGSERSRVETTILNHSGDRINAVGRYDGVRDIWQPAGVFLESESPTFVVVTAHIYARARGRGSFAEINFNDGPTNWVRGRDLYYTNDGYGPPR